MKALWTIEDWGWALRVDGAPRALLVLGQPPYACGFYVRILERDLPEGGPYRDIAEAAQWTQSYLVRIGVVPADTTFSDVPRPKGGQHYA